MKKLKPMVQQFHPKVTPQQSGTVMSHEVPKEQMPDSTRAQGGWQQQPGGALQRAEALNEVNMLRKKVGY